MTTRATIGEAARLTGLTAKRIRHYESLGLLPKARRTASGYRFYDDVALHTLRFVAHARELGFGMDEIAELVGLWGNRRRSSAEVKRLVARHVDELRRRAAELARLERALEALAARCHGDDRPACPILDAIEDGSAHVDRVPPRAVTTLPRSPRHGVAVRPERAGGEAGRLNDQLCGDPNRPAEAPDAQAPASHRPPSRKRRLANAS